MDAEQREVLDTLKNEAVDHALIMQRRELCREVDQEVYSAWDTFIWSELQGKDEKWTVVRKHSTAHRQADRVRKIMLEDRWLNHRSW
jgi:hypothetical protein